MKSSNQTTLTENQRSQELGDYILEMSGVTKAFGHVIANNQIDLKVRKGEIHAVVGENGSGKSTLMKILNGLHHPDSGQINFKGRPVTIANPGQAVKLGVGMVYQHFMLVKTLSVTENMILGVEPKKMGFLDIALAEKKVLEVSERYGLKINPQARIDELSVGMQQRVEILKVLFKGTELLIFDEPSAVLTPQEVKDLFKIMKHLIKEGKTIIFITHKLQEVLDISNNITVLRRGKSVADFSIHEATQQKIAQAMIGRDILFQLKKKPSTPGQTVFTVKNLNIVDHKVSLVKEISFDIREGEILGIAGVNGNGQSELIEGIAGLRKNTSGNITLGGKDITHKHPREITLQGLSHIPEDRLGRGAIADFDVAQNIALGVHREKYRQGIHINFSKLFQDSRDFLKKYDIRPHDYHFLFRQLSGGNQQKVIIARELEKDHKLLIASQPTRGVDIGAIEFIHNQILNEKEKGKAILLVSSEISEIMALSDRIIVMFEGQICGMLDRKDATEEKLGILMTGGKLD